MPTTETKARNTVRWVIPGVALLIGVAYLVAGLVGDDLGFAIFGFALMAVIGLAFLVVARWSETIAGLRDRNDERINQLDRSASLFAGMAVLCAVIVMFVVEIAQGEDGSPYYQLGALGGAVYVVALVVLRYRG